MDHPITLRELHVRRIDDLTPSIRRVALAGAQLGPLVRDGIACPAFVSEAADDHVKIFPPVSDPLVLPTQHDGHLHWPEDPPAVARDYTVRRFDAASGELLLDVVLGHDGPGAVWAEHVAVGDRIHVAGPRHSVEHPMDAASYVLVGDEAALPAIARFCDELPDSARVCVVAVARDDDRAYPLAAPRIVWIDPVAGDAALFDAVRAAVATEPAAYVWAALEFGAARALRAVLQEAGVARSSHYVTHYWRRAVTIPAEERAAAEALVRPLVDLVAPTVLRVAVTVGLPDALAAGADTRVALAGRTGCDPDAIGVVLEYLQARGLVRSLDDERYELTTAGELLREDDPSGLAGFLDQRGANGHMATALPALRHAVETGGSAYEHVHGRTFWQVLDADRLLGSRFDRQLAGWADQWAPAVAALDVWPPHGRVLDVGGGQGVLAAALAASHPMLEITLLELGGAAERARQALAAGDLAAPVDVVTGSFFDPLPRADRIVLAQVLHDWRDDDATRILHRCADALAPDGRLLIAERLPAGGAGAGDHAAMSVLMLALFGAKERTRSDYDALLAGAGLEIVALHPTGTALAVLEARLTTP